MRKILCLKWTLCINLFFFSKTSAQTNGHNLFSVFLFTVASSLSVGSIMPPCFSHLFTSFSSVHSTGLLTLPSWKPPISFCAAIRWPQATQISLRVLQRVSYLTPPGIVSKCFAHSCSTTHSFQGTALGRVLCLAQNVSCVCSEQCSIQFDLVLLYDHGKVHIKASLRVRSLLV